MRIVLAFVAALAGCAFFSETQKPDMLPVLVYRTALPGIPTGWASSPPRIEVMFHITRTGSVSDVRFVSSPGDDVWESGALEEMKQWRFSPARVGKDSVPVWVRVPIVLRFTGVNVLNLAQLVCPDEACADSAYQLLLAGHAFEVLVRELPSAVPGAYEKVLGKADISAYPKEIQKELMKLRDNEFTRPMRLGNTFVIFKRVPTHPVPGV